jgi:hypothetical protein
MGYPALNSPSPRILVLEKIKVTLSSSGLLVEEE